MQGKACAIGERTHGAKEVRALACDFVVCQLREFVYRDLEHAWMGNHGRRRSQEFIKKGSLQHEHRENLRSLEEKRSAKLQR